MIVPEYSKLDHNAATQSKQLCFFIFTSACRWHYSLLSFLTRLKEKLQVQHWTAHFYLALKGHVHFTCVSTSSCVDPYLRSLPQSKCLGRCWMSLVSVCVISTWLKSPEAAFLHALTSHIGGCNDSLSPLEAHVVLQEKMGRSKLVSLLIQGAFSTVANLGKASQQSIFFSIF